LHFLQVFSVYNLDSEKGSQKLASNFPVLAFFQAGFQGITAKEFG